MIDFIARVKNDSLLKIAIQEKADILANNMDNTSSSWLWFALAEAAIILVLIYKIRKKNSELVFANLTKDKLRSAKTAHIDMNNVMNSINGSKDLYRELSRQCHPDRFINSDKQQAAENIFQEVSKHRLNFDKLSELKERAIIELELKIK